MTVVRLGLMRDLRKICQGLSRAMSRSAGALGAARARLTVRWVRVSSPPGGRLGPVVTQGPAPWLARSARIGTPWRSQIRMMRWVRAAVRLWVRPGSGAIGPAVADAVALGECPVQQDELGIVLAQCLEQARRAVGEQAGHGGDTRVDGADGYPEPGRDPGEGVVAARVHQSDERPLVRRKSAPPLTLTGDDEHRDPLDQGMRKVEFGRTGNQQGSCADGLRRRTPPPTARGPCVVALTSTPPVSPDQWPH